jgi:pSer/pThr/pTyr-binding forkhead associated (FHA) protein
MTNHSEADNAPSVYIQLLDSSQGRPVQVWHFEDLSTITIGRLEENDICIADHQVSRLHARLTRQDGKWTLISVGRNGTVVNDRLVSEVELSDKSVFRLGTDGPTLRFHLSKTDIGRSETVSNFDANMITMLAVDETRKQEEVDQITANSLFKDLLEKTQELKTRRQTSRD